jgi:hypothetical protein
VAESVLDVSETGIRLVLKTALPKGQEIEVRLENFSVRPIKAAARIIWSMPTADGKFCAGASFDKPLPYASVLAFAQS